MDDATGEAVPTGARRPRQGEAFWREMVMAWTASGLGARRFCREQGLAVSTFSLWRKKLIQDDQSRQRWSVLYAAVIPGTENGPIRAPLPPPPRAQREEFFIGDTVGFTDKHLSERVGIIVRLNAKTASIAVNDSEGHWRV